MKFEENIRPIVALVTTKENEDFLNAILVADVQLSIISEVSNNIKDWEFSPNIIVFDAANLSNWKEHWERFKEIEAYYSIPSILVTENRVDITTKLALIKDGIFGVIDSPNWDELTVLCTTALVQGKVIKDNELKSNELNRILSTNYLVIDAKNAQLEKVKNQLGKITESTDEILQISLNALIFEIEQNLKKEHHYQLFKVHFEEVHPLFYKKLLDINPKLTDNNLKLLAFLKMGFNNDEISFLLNVSMAAVKKSIQRLKAKLYLRSEDSLRAFLFTVGG